MSLVPLVELGMVEDGVNRHSPGQSYNVRDWDQEPRNW